MATVIAVHVRAGDRVRRGAPLVSLDARELTANRDRAAASSTAARESSRAAVADVAAAEAGVTIARATHRRIADLAAKQSATPQELDQAVAALTAAEAQLHAAEARRAAATASLGSAAAANSAAETTLTYAELTAPFDAVVSERAVDPGAMAVPGTPLLTLEVGASRRLEVRVDEARAGQVHVGDSVEFALGSEAGPHGASTWTAGRVSEIERLDSVSHAFTVKIELPPNVDARSGSYGRARLVGPARRMLTFPAAALVRRGQLAFVFTVDSGNVARLRAVSPGEAVNGNVEALAGLADGEAVVINPPPALTDGRTVQGNLLASRGETR
jgi:RND family efflux transporter MFP subunit